MMTTPNENNVTSRLKNKQIYYMRLILILFKIIFVANLNLGQNAR